LDADPDGRDLLEGTLRLRQLEDLPPSPEAAGLETDGAAASSRVVEPPPDTAAADESRLTARLFLRAFGLVYLVVFASLAVQVQALMGSDGVLSVHDFLAAQRADGWSRFWRMPTLFWLWDGDVAVRGGAILGMALAVCLLLGWRSKSSLLGLWLIFLSYVTVGREFFWFQWDSLLLESTAIALLLPASPRLAPHPMVVFLFRWLVFRLLFESGLAKVQAGAESWFPLTAMAAYYETVPLPSLGGWHAHQLPGWFHSGSSALILLGELVGPLLIWGPRTARRVAFFLIVGFQAIIEITANYGYFNILSATLALFLLDDRDIRWLAGWIRRPLPTPGAHVPRPRRQPGTTWLIGGAASALFLLTLLELLMLVAGKGVASSPVLSGVRGAYVPFRLASNYHLFAHIDPRRVETEIEWTTNGREWRPAQFHYKPGNLHRAPTIVAPHQPRVDFQLWFFTLGRDGGYHPYFDGLVARLCQGSPSVRSLFRAESLPPESPLAVRVAFYRYRMTDLSTRARDGLYWTRELLDYHPRAYFCDSREPPRF